MDDECQERSQKDIKTEEKGNEEKKLLSDPDPKASSVNLLEKLREQFSGLFFGGTVSTNFFHIDHADKIDHKTERRQREESSDGDGEEKSEQLEGIRNFSMVPRDVYEYLQRFVIRQEEAKKVLSVTVCDHYNHVRHCLANPDAAIADYSKPNVLLLGPTGVGKTYLMRNLAKLLGVPFAKGDATKFSETGYIGNDVEDLVRDLLRATNGNAELAQYGIIFIDEVDKIASSEESGRDVSGRGVQINLLKLMEDADVSIVAPNDITAQMRAMVNFDSKTCKKKSISTRHILFIVSGAFDKLNDHVRRRTADSAIGFGCRGKNGKNCYLDQATTADFVLYGLEPEFIGRLPVRVACKHLEKNDLAQILQRSEGSILRQYVLDFSGYGIALSFDDDAIYAIAAIAEEEKTGARGLMTVLERLFRDFKFHLPSSAVRRLHVTKDVVANPEDHLKMLLSSGSSGAADFL
ncbi:MAG: AAA family ATPase [Puniceicoccales bacterium]|jgi:endopeptidase Clp ATP-binding regulatory subunit ClpX|nr:AAA family ATPase [Puniceicoccales bacterium]